MMWASRRSCCPIFSKIEVNLVGYRAGGDVREDQIPPISFAHFEAARAVTAATVAPEDLVGYEAWNRQFGSARAG